MLICEKADCKLPDPFTAPDTQPMTSEMTTRTRRSMIKSGGEEINSSSSSRSNLIIDGDSLQDPRLLSSGALLPVSFSNDSISAHNDKRMISSALLADHSRTLALRFGGLNGGQVKWICAGCLVDCIAASTVAVSVVVA